MGKHRKPSMISRLKARREQRRQARLAEYRKARDLRMLARMLVTIDTAR